MAEQLSRVEERLHDMQLAVPPVAAPVAAYVPAVEHAGVVYTSGQLPFVDGELQAVGKLGAELDEDAGIAMAGIACLNAIAAVKSIIGDLDRVTRVLKVTVFVASAPGFTAHPKIANGASELLGTAFGDAGVHARSAVGVAELPMGSPVEVELVVAYE
ncbi:RidA family protein [Pseudoclavibacter alba]|uniref:RidA family protein n=1 Tax=Pseudoclavibacter albus TaxID=272241 RepID=A0ABT2HY95_9MICO|nr:RidA family protein [Pseudoclavibacter alba]MBN6778374.1 RidA family protein [Pseudoclavibacter alba]MCT2043294.1 RidA family protein [Pseudoclavibacter alba]